MKDVVTAAPSPRRVLVTAFGPFPGAPVNPTLDVLRLLEADGSAACVFARLPVTFAGVAPALRQAVARHRPDTLVMLGLAVRRRAISVETVARNRVGMGKPDAEGCLAASPTLIEGAPETLVATWPAAAVSAALRDAGHQAALSDDAGDYVCNAALYHALSEGMAPRIGFLHVPPLSPSLTLGRLSDAVRLAIGALVERGDDVIAPSPGRDDAPTTPGRR